MKSVAYYNLLHTQPYSRTFQLQQRLQTLRTENRIGNLILLLEHKPVISIGRRHEAGSHLLADPTYLKDQGIEVCTTNRGGDITYHGPGQLVVYVIMKLDKHDIRRFVQKLEQSVIGTLARYDIQGTHHPEYPGVWVGEEKVCALGVYVRRWVTMHGIALNAHPNLSHFDFIVPCGIRDKGVTSIEKIYHARQRPYHLTIEQIKRDYLANFAETFQVILQAQDPETLWFSEI